MTGTTYSNSKVDGVLITRKRVDDLLLIMKNAAHQGVPEGIKLSLYKLNIKLSRAHNELEFDTLEEMDSVLADFPEWRNPTSMDLSITAYNHGYTSLGGKPSGSRLDFSRIMSVRFKSNSACHVYASGDSTRWGLTTGSLLESQLRKFRSWHRWARSWLVLLIALVSVCAMPALTGTLWFLVPTLLGGFTCSLLMAGMPMGRWFHSNRMSLGK